ncbi:MAG: DUF5676 family membrane protein [Nanoarchaeota archaeon]
MAERKNIHATGIAVGLTFGIISFICLVLVFVALDFALMLFGSFMHGIDLTKIAIEPSLNGRTLLGFVVVIIGGYVIGALFAALYNAFAQK